MRVLVSGEGPNWSRAGLTIGAGWQIDELLSVLFIFSEVVLKLLFSHLVQVGFNSKPTQRSLPLPPLIVTNESIVTAAGKTQVTSLTCLVVWL